MANGTPENFNTLTPHLVVDDAIKALEFYKKAFGGVEQVCLKTPDGKVMHASLQIGNSMLMLAEEMEECGSVSPKSLKGSPVTIHMYVADVDKAFATAIKAGGTAKMEPADMFWGDRYGVLVDPFGHSWSLATKQREVSGQELQTAASTAMCGA